MKRSDTALPGPFRILVVGVGFTIAHAPRLACLGTLYAVLLAVTWTVLDIRYTGIPALILVSGLILISFAWVWHRGFIIGPDELTLKAVFGSRKSKHRRRALLRHQFSFAWRAVGLIIALVLALLIYAVPFGLLADHYLDTIGEDDEHLEAAGYIVFSVMVLLTFPVARVLPVFAAIAVEEQMSCHDAWELSRGSGWRLALALIAIGIAYLVLLVIAEDTVEHILLQSPYDMIAPNLLVAILSILFIAVAASCNAFLFDELTVWHRKQHGMLDAFD